MALSFPRDMTTGRNWWPAKLWLNRRQEMSRSAGGAPTVADLGPALWRADFKTAPLPRDEADAILADFESLGGALRSFYAHPADRPRPAAAGGVISQGLSGTVRAVSSDRQRIGIDGLAIGLQLSAGDYLSVATAAGGREFMQLAEGGTVNSSRSAPMLTVTQPIRPAVAVDDAVSMSNPLVEMVLEPGSLTREIVNEPFHAVTFQAWQVVR